MLATVTLAGCGANIDPGPRAIDGVFPPIGDRPPLPFRVIDETGLIRALAVVNQDDLQDGISRLPGRDNAVYVQWLGGACDRLAVLAFEHRVDGHAFTLTTERDFGGCRLVGFQRSLVIEFTQPIDASAVSFDAID